MILSFAERQARTKARADEYRAGQLTEPMARASLFALRMRGADLQSTLNLNKPEARADYEALRMEASRAWLQRYLNRAD